MSQEVQGWYYLLGEELGRRKHLKVPTQQHDHDSDGNSVMNDATTTFVSNISKCKVLMCCCSHLNELADTNVG